MRNVDLPCRIVSISEDSDSSLDGEDDPDLYEVLEEVEALFKRVDVRPDSNENFFEACLGPDGHVLGASVVGLYDSTPDDADPLKRPRYSFSVAVDEPHRRKGIARALIESVLASFPKDEVLLEGKVVNPNIVALLKELGFYYADEDRDEEFSDFDRRVGRRMYRPNSKKLDFERDPDDVRRRLIRLADKKLLMSRRRGMVPMATAEDAAQAAMLAELDARRRGLSSPSTHAYKAMDEEIGRSASVVEVPYQAVRESLSALGALVGSADDWREAQGRRRAEGVAQTFRRVEPGESLAAPEVEPRDVFLEDVLEKVLDTLTFREREIIKLRYGFGDGYTYSLEEIGRIFRVPSERVREIEVSAHRKLQHPIRMQMLEDAYRALRGT